MSMAKELLIPMIVVLVVVVAIIGVLYFFSPFFKSPQQECAEKGMVLSPDGKTCISCAPRGSGCLLQSCCYNQNQQGQYIPMQCNLTWNPINLFKECQ